MNFQVFFSTTFWTSLEPLGRRRPGWASRRETSGSGLVTVRGRKGFWRECSVCLRGPRNPRFSDLLRSTGTGPRWRGGRCFAGKGLREERGSGKGAGMARNANPYDFANDAGHVMDVATADKLAEHPELLSVPLDNIARWIASGRHTSVSVQRLEQWRAWILEAQQDGAAFRRLLDLLRDDSEEARHWKSWSPFAGVLEAGEVSAIYESCLA